jgi:sulfur-oxidizing protein SoxY
MGMTEETRAVSTTRRGLFSIALGVAGATLVAAPSHSDDEAIELIKHLTGKAATESVRVRLAMPRVFANGYTVPLALEVDTPMTESDHVRHVRVLAPRNPIIEVASFHFVAHRSEPRVSTRIRLAEPQYVLAVAEMNDGALLMTRTWVEVATNGCT